MWIEVEGVSQAYGADRVLDRLSFRIARGMIGCLLGPSGCGKTTALRCIAGLEPVREGRIVADDVVLSEPGRMMPPEKRQIGMVFQDFALFPHLTVRENVAFGLRRQAQSERRETCDRVLEVVGMEDKRDLYPHQLSGGQQQRVALARALAPRPRLLLLDEPFSNLDPTMRVDLGAEVRTILKRLGITGLLVTHDQMEAFAIADEIGVMRAGRLEQWDTAYELYHRPASTFVARFVGEGTFLPGQVGERGTVCIELGELVARSFDELAAGTEVQVLLRPDDIVHDPGASQTARVIGRSFRGPQILYALALPSGRQVTALVPSHHDHAVGDDISVRLDAEHVVAFTPEGRRLS